VDTDQFALRVRKNSALPNVVEDWTDDDIFVEATEALRTRFATEIVNTGSGYWRHQTVVNTTANENEYRIPPRAVAQGLQKLEFSTDNGQTWSLMNIVTLGSDGLYESSRTGTPTHFSHYADYVRVFPTPADDTVKLRFTFYLSPPQLIPTLRGTVVEIVDDVTVRIDGDMSSFLSLEGGTLDVDATDGSCETVLIDVPYTSFGPDGGGAFDFVFPASTDLSRVAVGQVFRVPDTTDRIPLPREAHNTLASYTAAVILLSLGDSAQGEKLAAKAAGDIKRIIDLAIPRDKAHPKKIKPRNSYLRRNAGRRTWISR